jgi:DNA-binding response OmpR family regulator
MPTRIAILDDDQASRTSLSDALAEAGYEPVAFTPGIGVHEVLHDVAPAAIILDVPHDPSALHWPAVGVLAQDDALRAIPLLACVPADDEAPRRVAALGLFSPTLLCKPVALDDLLARLRRVVGDAPSL